MLRTRRRMLRRRPFVSLGDRYENHATCRRLPAAFRRPYWLGPCTASLDHDGRGQRGIACGMRGRKWRQLRWIPGGSVRCSPRNFARDPSPGARSGGDDCFGNGGFRRTFQRCRSNCSRPDWCDCVQHHGQHHGNLQLRFAPYRQGPDRYHRTSG
jgi:hypothetical protein